MGALHDGHRALLARAREMAGQSGTVVVSIFVNPLQFGPDEDLDRYSRTLPPDLEVCEAYQVGLVFAPGVHEMYPAEQFVTVDPGPAGDILEGDFRPGFFRGVLTVVLKLLSLVRPDVAVFGQKDAQQLTLVRRMVADFALGIEIEAVHGPRSGRPCPVEPEQVPVVIRSGGGACPAPRARDGCGGHRGRPRGGPRHRPARDAEQRRHGLYRGLSLVIQGGTYAPVRDHEFRGAAVLAVAAQLGWAHRQRASPGRDGSGWDGWACC